MIGDPVILFAVRSYFITALPGPELISTDGRSFFLSYTLAFFSQTSCQDTESDPFALVLGAHVHTHTNTGWLVRDGDATVRPIFVLPAWTRAPARLDVEFSHVELELLFLLWVKNGDRNSRRLNPASLLGGRDPLKSVPACFVREEPLGSLASEEDRNEAWPRI